MRPARWMTRLRGEETGMAMVLALMVTFVILLLSTVIVGQSIHSLGSSGYDRTRLQSVNAAEAGVDYFYTYFQTKSLSTMRTDCNATTKRISKTATVASAPATASYTSTVTFYSKDAATGLRSDTPMDCTTFSDNSYPSYALITSVGTVGATAPRTMQSTVRLTPIRSGYGGAILTNAGVSFGNNFDINGQNGTDGDVYILNGDLTITNSPTIGGNVYVPNGGATISNGATIEGDLWVRNALTLNNPAEVKGNAYSSTSTIAGSGKVWGNATALSTIAPAPGLTVLGTRSPSTNPGAVPTQTFPTIGWTSTDWTDVGYTVQPFTTATACTDAYNWIKNTWASGDVVVRISSPGTACTFTNGNNDTIALKGNLAIITDWGFNLGTTSNWNGIPTKRSLFFISTAPAGSCPASNSSNTKNISVGNNTNFDTYVKALFYTPCTATVANQNNFSGQVIATNVNISNNFTMTYYPVLVPGVGTISGFKQDIAYVREVA